MQFIERLAAMKTAAPDFRLYWDNAYAVHHLTNEHIEIANILELCARHSLSQPRFCLCFHLEDHTAWSRVGPVCRDRAITSNGCWQDLSPQTIGPGQDQPDTTCSFSKRESAGIVQLMEQAQGSTRAQIPKGARHICREANRGSRRKLDPAQGWLFHQP